MCTDCVEWCTRCPNLSLHDLSTAGGGQPETAGRGRGSALPSADPQGGPAAGGGRRLSPGYAAPAARSQEQDAVGGAK